VKRIAYTVVDRLFLVAYGLEAPTDEEWVAYLKLVERHGISRTMQIIATDGGGPTQIQRRYLNDLLAGRSVPVAVISASARVRAMVTAISWFNRAIQAFPPSGLRDAIAYLEIPASRTELISRKLAELRAQVVSRAA